MNKARDAAMAMGVVLVISLIWLLGTWSVAHHAMAYGVESMDLPRPTALLIRWVEHWWVFSVMSFIAWVDVLRRREASTGHVVVITLISFAVVGCMAVWLILGLTLPLVPLR